MRWHFGYLNRVVIAGQLTYTVAHTLFQPGVKNKLRALVSSKLIKSVMRGREKERENERERMREGERKK